MHHVRIVLDLLLNPAETPYDPRGWDWATLLDLLPDERVLAVATTVETVPQQPVEER
jgi:hypothetical protein